MFRKLLYAIGIFIVLLNLAVFAAEPAQTQAKPEAVTLQKCLESAYQTSEELKGAQKTTAIAQEAVKQAKAAFGPSLDYEVGGTKSSSGSNILIKTPPYVVTGPDHGYSGSINYTQPITTFGRLEGQLKITQAQLRISQEEERKIRQSIAYNVTNNYYQLWLVEQSLVVAQNAYNNMGRRYQQVQQFYNVGTASKYDLLRAQVQWESLKPNVIRAENGVIIAQLALATAAGLDKNRRYTVSYDPEKLVLPEKPIYVLDGVLSEAYTNRPEMKELKIGMEIAKFQTGLAKTGNSPTLGVQFSYSASGENLNVTEWGKRWTLSLGLNGNLFNSGGTASEINAAKLGEERFIHQEAQLKDGIQLNAEQGLQSIKESIETIKANQANIGLAKESLRLTQARYDAGMATTMDIMDAEVALDQALNGYYNGIYSYLKALANLELVMGKNK